MAADLHFRCFFAGNYREANKFRSHSCRALNEHPLSQRGSSERHPAQQGVQPRYGQKPPSAGLEWDFRCSGGHGLSVLGFDRSPNHESRHLIRALETHSTIH
jgi:hypothetical protein